MNGRAAPRRISCNCSRPNDDSVPLPYRLLVNGYFGNVFALTHTHLRRRIFRGKMTKASAKNTNPTRSSPIFRFTTPNSLRSLRVLLFRRTKNNYFFNGKRAGKKWWWKSKMSEKYFYLESSEYFPRKHVFRGPKDALPRWLAAKQAVDALKHWVTPQLACDETKIISGIERKQTTSERAATPICTLFPTTPPTSALDNYVFS